MWPIRLNVWARLYGWKISRINSTAAVDLSWTVLHADIWGQVPGAVELFSTSPENDFPHLSETPMQWNQPPFYRRLLLWSPRMWPRWSDIFSRDFYELTLHPALRLGSEVSVLTYKGFTVSVFVYCLIMQISQEQLRVLLPCLKCWDAGSRNVRWKNVNCLEAGSDSCKCSWSECPDLVLYAVRRTLFIMYMS